MDSIMGIQTQAGAIRQEELTEANLVPVVIRLTERVGQIEDSSEHWETSKSYMNA